MTPTTTQTMEPTQKVPVSQDRKSYNREYYEKNRERMKQMNREAYQKRKARGVRYYTPRKGGVIDKLQQAKETVELLQKVVEFLKD